MPDGVDGRRRDGGEDPVGLGRGVEVEVTVDAGDAPVELEEEVLVVVEAAVGPDVELGAVENREAGMAHRELVELGAFPPHLVPGEAVDREVLAVFGHRQVLESAPGCRGHHVLETGAAVPRPCRVHVEIAANVALLDEARHPALCGGGDLTDALAQLGRDEDEVQRVVDRLFGAGGDDLAAVGVGEGVLVEDPAPFDRPLPELDVVCLRAGEVEDRGPVLAGRHDAQVDLEVVVGEHGGLRLAPADDLPDAGQAGEGVHHRCRVAGGDDDVDVSDRLPEPAQAAAVLGPPHGG